jgi:ATPase family AAA domain-containing protein 2
MPMTSRPPNAAASYIVDEKLLAQFHDELTTRTSGCSVEQLEQLNAALMDSIWNTKHNGDRVYVTHACKEAFNATIKDIEKMQAIMEPSQRLQDQSREGP